MQKIKCLVFTLVLWYQLLLDHFIFNLFSPLTSDKLQERIIVPFGLNGWHHARDIFFVLWVGLLAGLTTAHPQTQNRIISLLHFVAARRSLLIRSLLIVTWWILSTSCKELISSVFLNNCRFLKILSWRENIQVSSPLVPDFQLPILSLQFSE